MIPLFGLAGTALDYSRANSARTAMQAAIDSTALMLSKDARGLTVQQLNQKATDYFNALFTRSDVTDVLVKPTYDVLRCAAG